MSISAPSASETAFSKITGPEAIPINVLLHIRKGVGKKFNMEGFLAACYVVTPVFAAHGVSEQGIAPAARRALRILMDADQVRPYGGIYGMTPTFNGNIPSLLAKHLKPDMLRQLNSAEVRKRCICAFRKECKIPQ